MLTPGTNTLRAFARDVAGNHSLTNSVNFVYVLAAPLGVEIVGNGKVSAASGQLFEIGRSVALTATPGTGWILTNWLVRVAGDPVLSTNRAVPFLMASNMMLTATFADVARPNLTIAAPTANQRISNEVFIVRGRVTDNHTNGTLWYQLNGGTWAAATGWTNWQAEVSLVPGTNNVKAYAMDAAGNRSATNSVNFVRVLAAPLGLEIVGNGRVNAVNGQLFEIGRNVALIATPGTGWILTNWLVRVAGDPVLSTNRAAPFLMASNMVLTASFADVAKPTLSLTAPTANQRISNDVFIVRGRVTDNNPAGTNWYQLNGGAWAAATGWTNWQAEVLLVPGTNNVKAYAMDAAGNRSATNSVNFVRVLTAPLEILIVGNGKINSATNGQLFEIGKFVVPTVTPATGWILTNWLVQVNGSTTISTNRAAPFLMASNMVLTATFADVAKPTLTISAPTANQRWTNEMFTVIGKVMDNAASGQVRYQLNNSAWANATGWSNWTALVMLKPGTNTLRAYAEDLAGNRSMTNTLSFVYAAPTYALADYFYPPNTNLRLIYQAFDGDGSAPFVEVRVLSTNYPITMYAGTTTVNSFQTNSMRVRSARGAYVSETDQFIPYDTWEEYFYRGNGWGIFGYSDSFESIRAEHGFIVTNRISVGQTVSQTRNIYSDGAYVGQATYTLQLLEVVNVTVPAGTFPGCLRVRITLASDVELEAYERVLRKIL